MPELPEIINFKRYVDSTSLHQSIDRVEVNHDGVLGNSSADELQNHLEGNQFESTSTHGKYLFLHTDGDRDLMMHFGMTGEPVYYKEESKQPDYPRVEFIFANGYRLAFNCMRMLGKVGLIRDKESFIEEKELGPDVYSEKFDFDTFRELLKGRRGMIKPALMDQSLMAGIGNECSDEILFQARIHPKSKVNDLDTDQLREIYEAMQEVIRKKIDSNLKIENLPDSYILRHREEGAECPKCGGKVQRVTVGGRTGYYCPECQEG